MDSGNDTQSDDDINISDEETEEINVNIETIAITSIYHQYIQKDNILLRPEYQRDLCWSQIKMNMFIDTIMKNYIVPNYVIYKVSSNEIPDHDYKYECIDGQHRLMTLKLYITGTNYPNTNKYIYWKKDKIKVFYDKIPTSIKNKKNTRIMTNEEKEIFDIFKMSFHTINATSKKGLIFKTKCEIFNRLQNGEKVSSYQKLKNNPNPIIVNIRMNKLIDLLIKYNLIDKINIDNKTPEQFYLYFLIRTYLIIDKKSLDINYLDLNIKKYIEAQENQGTDAVKIKSDIDLLGTKTIEIINYISTNKNIKDIIPELLYIYICVYVNYGINDLDKIINIFINKSIYDKYNKLKTYKLSHDKVTSKDTIIKIYNEIIKKYLN